MYYLSIEAGGTKTTGILSDLRGQTVRTKKAGAGNIAVLKQGPVLKLLKKLVYGLLEGEDVAKIEGATFAFAGAGRAEEKGIAQKIIAEIGIKNFNVLSDAELLYYAIHGEGQGILLEAGTGSVCIVRKNKNELVQFGGWGYLLGDAGSGYDIGRAAIRAALRACEIGEAPSELTMQLLSFYEVDQPKDLITTVYSIRNPQELVASSAQLVCEQALNGEPHAIRIINTAANALLELALSAMEQLATTPPYKIALAGSILSKDSPVVHEFKKKADTHKLELQYVSQTMLPVAAGVLMSVQSAGKMVSNSLREKMNKVRFEY